MEVESKITFSYRTNEEARVVLGSLKPDNTDFMKVHLKNNSLVFCLKSRSLRTILATIDDLLFCKMMAEKITDFTKKR